MANSNPQASLPKPVSHKVTVRFRDLNDNLTVSGQFMSWLLAKLLGMFPKSGDEENGRRMAMFRFLTTFSSGTPEPDSTIPYHVNFKFPAGGLESDKLECVATPVSESEIEASIRVTNREVGKNNDGIIANFVVVIGGLERLPGLDERPRYFEEPPVDRFKVNPAQGVLDFWHDLTRIALDIPRQYSERMDRVASPDLEGLKLAYLVNAGDWYIMRVPEIGTNITSTISTLEYGRSSRTVRMVFYANGEPFALYDIVTVRMLVDESGERKSVDIYGKGK